MYASVAFSHLHDKLHNLLLELCNKRTFLQESIPQILVFLLKSLRSFHARQNLRNRLFILQFLFKLLHLLLRLRQVSGQLFIALQFRKLSLGLFVSLGSQFFKLRIQFVQCAGGVVDQPDQLACVLRVEVNKTDSPPANTRTISG